MRLNFTANNLLLDAQIVKMRPEHFSESSQGDYFQNASELHGKQLHFWTQKSGKCAQNFFCKTRSQRTSRMHLTFTANRFVFGHKNRVIALRTVSVNLAGRELPNASELHGKQLVIGRKNRENAPRTFFIKLARRLLPKCV